LFLGNANNDEFYIDQISVGKFNPQTQILEDLSTRLSASESAITVESDRIDLFTQKSNELNRIAEVNATYNATTTQTSIALINTRSGFEVRNGQTLFLVNVDGTFQSVTVNGNQTLSTSVTINSEVFVTTILAGAMLYESSFTSSSRITQQAGTIVLKATESGGSLNKLALVRLDTSAADGSAILLQANQITLDGQTTFLNSLAVNRFTQVASNNEVIESGTAPTVRPNASALVEGDVWIDTANNRRPSVWNGSIWGRGFSVINGGTITTGTVNANRLDVTGIFATNVSITGTLAMGSGGKIKQDSDKWELSNTGIFLGSGQGVFDQATALNIGNRMRIYAVDGSPDVDGAYFEMFESGTFMKFISQSNVIWEIASGSTMSVNRAFSSSVSVSGNSLIVGTGANKATISYTTNTARTLTIPNVGGNRTFSFIDQAQTLSANQTFNFGNFLLRNTGNNGSATINYGTASADRTYTFAGANGTIWTTGNLQLTDVGGASAINNRSIDISFGGNVYRINCELLP